MNARRLTLIVLIPWILASCSTYQQQAGLVGGLAGAGLGAVFGDDHQDVVAGAAVGAALGAGGAAIHEQNRQRRYAGYGNADNAHDRPQSVPQGAPRRELAPAREPEPSYPKARRTETPDEVTSPYPPYHRINVSGFRSGQRARDPKTGKVFLVP